MRPCKDTHERRLLELLQKVAGDGKGVFRARGSNSRGINGHVSFYCNNLLKYSHYIVRSLLVLLFQNARFLASFEQLEYLGTHPSVHVALAMQHRHWAVVTTGKCLSFPLPYVWVTSRGLLKFKRVFVTVSLQLPCKTGHSHCQKLANYHWNSVDCFDYKFFLILEVFGNQTDWKRADIHVSMETLDPN